MRFKNAPQKKSMPKESSIIRNTLGNEEDEEGDAEEEEEFEDIRIEEGESFANRASSLMNP